MGINDIVKNSFLNNFTETVSLSTVIATGQMSLVFAAVVYIVYLLTCDKTIYSKKFNVAMSLMTIITSALVMAMQANIVISLGMVGALSIVRFRTAIKEPKDLLFLFWSISNGIIIGAGLYSIACVLAVVLSIALIVFELIPARRKSMLLVVNLTSIEAESVVEKELKKYWVRFKVKSRNVFRDKADIMYEISTRKDRQLVTDLSKLNEILSVNLIKQD
ncbi:MAG: DUF4956 domain-containing protein [Clostridia bacterium]|nr:DUF4956 domain-containing protein [Clostridia bacterium]